MSTKLEARICSFCGETKNLNHYRGNALQCITCKSILARNPDHFVLKKLLENQDLQRLHWPAPTGLRSEA